MSDEFAGKNVVITGAAGIYGTELAQSFAAAGARLFLTDRDGVGLMAVRAKLGSAEIASTTAELTEPDSVAALCRQITDWAIPDVVINNAGIYPFGGLLDTPVEMWDRIMHVNLRAPFLITQALAKAMIAAKRKGAFIFIGSGAGQVLRTNGLAYCASKRALEWLMKGVALELAPHGIRANLVAPGLALGSAATQFPAGYAEAMGKRVPLGRGIKPGELSQAVMFLASESAGYITGASLSVDGGGAIPRRALD
ncbi:MAG TPA: SDR family oxidoreductase [Stellaceae bacterium]|jgi:3-oxoacyl-[acyl-carrier protein] reductase|nr:SDR family oxidoreductase [Stellaceae bacterium]